jgi:hypothetical protein
MYFLTGLACIRFYLVEKRDEFNILLHLIIPVLGIVLIVPAWCTAVGIPAFQWISPLSYPYSLVGPIVGGWMLIGLVYFVYLLIRAPQRFDDVARVFLEEDDSVEASRP